LGIAAFMGYRRWQVSIQDSCCEVPDGLSGARGVGQLSFITKFLE